MSTIIVETSHDTCEPFDRNKIVATLEKEVQLDKEESIKIARSVERQLKKLAGTPITSSQIREMVNERLIKKGKVEEAQQHQRVGIPVAEIKELIRGHNTDNANLQRNPETAHKFVADVAFKEYALLCLPDHLEEAHRKGDLHIHDLEYFPARPVNCLQHDLRWFIKDGLRVDGEGDHTSVAAPPKRLETLMNHAGEILLAGQQNMSGGQSFPLFNVFAAPFCKGLSYRKIRQKVQMFIFNLNMAYSNRGGQVPFTSINLEFGVPDFLKDEPAWGPEGKQYGTYKDWEGEVRELNRAFIDVLMEGDAMGKPHLFPNTIWVLRQDVVDGKYDEELLRVHELSAKFSIPYFANVIPDWTGGHSNVMGSIAYDTLLLHRVNGLIDIKPACDILTPEARSIEVMTFNDEGEFEWKPIEIIIEKPPSPLYEITTRQGRKFSVTGNHKIPVLRNRKMVEVKSENLSIGDELIQFTMPQTPLSEPALLDILLGIFIADGHIRRSKNTTQIEFHIKKEWKKKQIRDICSKLNLQIGERGNHLIIENKQLRDLFVECYDGKDKVIPIDCFNDLTRLNGIRIGLEFDGHKHSSGRRHFYTSSEKLASQYMLILDLLGYSHHHYVSERNGWSREYNISSNHKYPSKNIIKSIELIENDKPVFDMQIKDNHNYVCGEGLVSIFNCRTRLNANWTGDWDMDTLRTGNLAYITINLPRLAYKSEDIEEFYEQLGNVLSEAEEILLIRRKHALKCLNEVNMFPFLAQKNKEGEMYYRIDNTTLSFGFVGLDETLRAMGIKEGLKCAIGQEKGKEILRFFNKRKDELIESTGLRWTVLQTPGESTCHRFATLDKEHYPDRAIVNGEEGGYYYTNSSHVPVCESDMNLLDKMLIESQFHPLTGGGHIFHAWLGESHPDPEGLMSLTKKIAANSDIGFWAYTSAFSFCFGCNHFMRGLQENCTQCGCEDEVEYYSRITGYIQQVGHKKNSGGGWNAGKRSELKDRFEHEVT